MICTADGGNDRGGVCFQPKRILLSSFGVLMLIAWKDIFRFYFFVVIILQLQSFMNSLELFCDVNKAFGAFGLNCLYCEVGGP